jgi:hypothetical protein
MRHSSLVEAVYMRVVIRKGFGTAVIISFHTRSSKFDSDYERSKFFRELHGWKQTIPKENKKYIYKRSGLLDQVPHIKIADSVFMVAMEHMKRMSEFFDEWNDKVDCNMMEVMVNMKKLRRLEED